MKYILIFAIVLIALARRHHQPDPVLACLQGTCKKQFEVCDNSEGCVNQLKQCMKVQERDPLDFDAGFQCLQKKGDALAVFQCIFEKCVGFHGV